MKIFTNRFDVNCATCKTRIATGNGFTEFREENGRKIYTNYCKDHLPHRKPETNQVRVLTSDGKIFMPYEPANLPLVKSLPGARFNPEDKSWSVSLKTADRRRILEVADKIGLEVAPSLRAVEISAQAEFAKTAGLYEYQVAGVDWLSQKSKALLGDEMGLGKTAQSLMVIPSNGAGLVVCRASLLFNWADETAKWRKDLTPVIIRAGGVNKKTRTRYKVESEFRFPNPGEVVIVNPEQLPDELNNRPAKKRGQNDAQFFADLQAWRNQLAQTYPNASNTQLIIDEAHDYKNRKAGRSRKVKELGFLTGKVTGLTGSPLSNRPEDLFGVLDTIGVAKDVFGKYENFQKLFNAHHNGWAMVYGKPNPIVPELLRRVMLRRLRNEVLKDLPSKVYSNFVVGEPTGRLKSKLDELWDSWEGALLVGELPDFTEFASVRAALAESRTEAMLDYIENCEEQEVPLLVFSSHLAPLDSLIGRDGWRLITGETKPEVRQEIVNDFQSGKLKGLGCTIRAAGVGLTLTHAAKALFVDLDWSPAANWQAEDRICRIGQKRNSVEIVRMVSDHPLDLHIQNLLIDKIDTIVRSVDKLLEGEHKNSPSINSDVGETEEQYLERMKRIENFHAEESARNAEESQRQAKEKAKGKVSAIHSREAARLNVPMLPLTPERIESVRQAFLFMLGRCDGAVERDGQGFNKPDAAVAHCLLTAGLETDQELEAGFMILSRYHRQLKDRFPIIFRNAA
jgi:SWI/SNF-related matrix-associated actin-dependent regulator 1 of chromatin subfamily A